MTPELGLDWIRPDLADHDFGVPPSGAIAGRPACEVGDVVTFEAGGAASSSGPATGASCSS